MELEGLSTSSSLDAEKCQWSNSCGDFSSQCYANRNFIVGDSFKNLLTSWLRVLRCSYELSDHANR